MSGRPLRWGILSAAQIARRNWRAIYDSGNSTVSAVASRDLAHSRQLISDCQEQWAMASVPRAYGSYEGLLADGEVDAVYIPLPTAVRKTWVIRAAEAGKHVLCEKPCAVSSTDLREMIDACRRHRVQFMDGVMFQHSSRLAAMRQVLEDGVSVGILRRVTCANTNCVDDSFFTSNIRADGALEPHGCLGDLGWYCIRFILWAVNWRMPLSVSGRLIAGGSGPKPVPMDFSAELLFPEGISSTFHCSFSVGRQQRAIVSGTRGHLQVSDFMVPVSGNELGFTVSRMNVVKEGYAVKISEDQQRFAVAERGYGHPSAQDAAMFRSFAAQIRSGTLNEFWPDISLKTQQVLDACYDSAMANAAEA